MRYLCFLFLMSCSFSGKAQTFCDSTNFVLVLFDENKYMLQSDVRSSRFDLYFLSKEKESKRIIKKILKLSKKNKSDKQFSISVKNFKTPVLLTDNFSRYCRENIKENIEIIQIIKKENNKNLAKPYSYILGKYYM